MTLSTPLLILLTANAFVFSLVALLHVYWAMGGHWALVNALPQKLADHRPVFTPGRLMTLVVAIVLVICLLVNLLPWLKNAVPTGTPIRYGLLAIGLMLGVRTLGDFMYVGLSKRVRNTPFARNDTLLYTPLCALLSLSHILCFIWLA